MAPQPDGELLAVEEFDGIKVATFLSRGIWDDGLIQSIGQELRGLVGPSVGGRLVLDFGNVDGLASVMLGKLIGLHKAMKSAGGRLALCNIRPKVYEIFQLLRLPDLLNVYATRQEALDSFR